MGKLKIEITADSANPNNLRVHYQGAQLCKVYGWTPEDAQKRAEMLASALRIAARVLDEGAVEGLAEMFRTLPVHAHDAELDRARRVEAAIEVLSYLKGEGHD